ncbi:hypothetical protein H6A60_11670 [Sutterella massiliensis]|uniref:TATA-binding-like protein domain-containing protein n=2 Tax=Sutterella massiliensis TaxID=1816689 RepID=A0ABS2DUU8_9BURK|nr:hypothetical protein [Sutterella massiliensis]
MTRAKRKLFFYNAPRFTSSTGLSFAGNFLGAGSAAAAPCRARLKSPSPATHEPFARYSSEQLESRSAQKTRASTEFITPVVSDADKFSSRAVMCETVSIPSITPPVTKDVALGDLPPSFLSILKDAVADSLILLDAKIIDVQHLQYCESYTVEWGGEYVRADVFYNAKNEVTRVRPGGTDPLSITVAKHIRQLEGGAINSSAPTQGLPRNSRSSVRADLPDPVVDNIKPLFDESFKQEFYDRLLAAATSRGVSVALVREMQWALRINMQGFGGLAVMDFFYNSKEVFTKIVKVSTKKMTSELSAAISGIVNEIAE